MLFNIQFHKNGEIGLTPTPPTHPQKNVVWKIEQKTIGQNVIPWVPHHQYAGVDMMLKFNITGTLFPTLWYLMLSAVKIICSYGLLYCAGLKTTKVHSNNTAWNRDISCSRSFYIPYTVCPLASMTLKILHESTLDWLLWLLLYLTGVP